MHKNEKQFFKFQQLLMHHAYIQKFAVNVGAKDYLVGASVVLEEKVQVGIS